MLQRVGIGFPDPLRIALGDLYMERVEDVRLNQSVQRYIPSNVRVIQALLYFAVIVFALIGAYAGLLWGFLSVGTLVFAWYFMGVARVTFHYVTEGTKLRVQRISGFASRPKKEEFAQFDLRRVRICAPEGSPLLDGEEQATAKLSPRRVTYDLTSHTPNRVCAVMFLEGIGDDANRQLKVFFEPSAELRAHMRRIARNAVKGFEDEIR